MTWSSLYTKIRIKKKLLKSEHLLWDLKNLSSRENLCYRCKAFYLKVSFFDPVKETSALVSIKFKSWIDLNYLYC